ncbi:MAG TPA: SUMF1/EgtB/PvdO family nonheme iron enzyme [Kofleriaceae bacterium]
MNANPAGGGAMCPVGQLCGSTGPEVCVLPTCGNGVLDPGEECDDGNNASGDGCPADCAFHSPLVTGGTFYRGYDVAGDGLLGNRNLPATVSSFRLDKYEVTVRRFREFVTAGMGTQTHPPAPYSGAHSNLPDSGWDPRWNAELALTTANLIGDLKIWPFHTWTDVPGPNEERPINAVSWYEAMAFCIWDGGYLPTATEWNYAATGGDQQRAYPWSDPPGSLIIDSAHASYGEFGPNGSRRCFGDGMPGCALTDLVEVGSKPAGDGRWGQSDLAGNASEWTLDWYSTTPINPCVDCANLTPGEYRIVGGGDLFSPPLEQRANFQYEPGIGVVFGIGVRCARPAP